MRNLDKSMKKDATCYILSIKACSVTGGFAQGRRIHAELEQTLQADEKADVQITTALINFLRHCAGHGPRR